MRRIGFAVGVVLAVATAACYHAVIETGRPAGSTVISKPWAHSFIYGLVPPAVVETAAQCPNGVARVETQHSFLNGLVASLTWGLYTPIQIDVTCAANRTSQAPLGRPDVVAHGSLAADRIVAMQAATDLAVSANRPVTVGF